MFSSFFYCIAAFRTLPFLEDVFLVRERQQVTFPAFCAFWKDAVFVFFHFMKQRGEFIIFLDDPAEI